MHKTHTYTHTHTHTHKYIFYGKYTFKLSVTLSHLLNHSLFLSVLFLYIQLLFLFLHNQKHILVQHCMSLLCREWIFTDLTTQQKEGISPKSSCSRLKHSFFLFSWLALGWMIYCWIEYRNIYSIKRGSYPT